MKFTFFLAGFSGLIFISCFARSNQKEVEIIKQGSPTSMGDTVPRLSDNVMVIYQAENGDYWFGSWEEGLYKYDGKTIIHFSIENGLPDNRVEEIKEDAHGVIYVTTAKGICQYSNTGFTLLHEDSLGLGGWKKSYGDLWFKSPASGGYVYRYDGKVLYKLKLPELPIGEDLIRKNPSASSPYIVYTIYTDKDQNIWFGTAALGALRYDGKKFDWISEEDVNEIHDGPANGVRSIIEDREGFIWFNSAYRYAIKKASVSGSETFYTREKSIGSLNGKNQDSIVEYLSVARDSSDQLWFATYRQGVWRYDGKEVKHYPVMVNGEQIQIFYIYKDPTGSLWLGTHEHGAWKLKGDMFERVLG